MLRSIGLYVAIGLGLLLAALSANPTRPVGVGAPDSAFSASRAMVDVKAIARAPHPMGSAENARVRDYLISRLQALGFAVEVFRAPAVLDGSIASGAYPETLIAVRPGRDRALPPVAIMSHYDSVPGSPGAADDAAGVAASLETARALAAAGPQARDLVLIVTDGEEPGLFGATAFFAGHPLAKRLGAVINLEARGSSGVAMMFETSPRNGALIRRYGSVAPRPAASSLLAWIYDNMPNDTDFTRAKDAGVAGLNFAFIGRPFDYHSATSTPVNLDRRSLQSMGDQTLAAAADLLDPKPLPVSAPSLVFSDVLGLGVIAYPTWAGWLLLIAAGGLIVLAVRRLGLGRPRPLEVLRGVGALLLIGAMSALALHLLGRFMPAGETYFQGRGVAEFGLFLAAMALTAGGFVVGLMADLTRGEGRWRDALVSLGVGVVCSLVGGWDMVGAVLAVVSAVLAFVLLGRPTAPTALWSGALFLGLVLAVVMQILAPTTAFVVAWPLLVGAALAAATSLGAEVSGRVTLALILVGGLTVAWTARLAGLAFDGMGMDLPEVIVPFLVFGLLTLSPLAARAGLGAFVAGFCVVAGLIVVAFIALHDPASPRTPQPSHLIHVTDLAHGGTLRVSSLQQPGSWTRDALGAGARREDLPAMFLRQAWIAPAPGSNAVALAIAAPKVTPSRVGDRAVLTVAAPGAREVRLSLKGVSPEGLTLGGLPVKARADAEGWLRLRWYAPRDGFTVGFVPPPGGKADYRIAAVSDGWPAGAAPLPPRPATVMPWQGSDSSVVISEGIVRW